MQNRSLYFFWDYDLDEAELNRILQSGSLPEKSWVICRILQYAKWHDIWKYLSVEQIKNMLPHLKMPSRIKKVWEYAVQRWSINA